MAIDCTGGVLGELSTVVLPTITPAVTAILTVVTMIPALIKLWRVPNSRTFIAATVRILPNSVIKQKVNTITVCRMHKSTVVCYAVNQDLSKLSHTLYATCEHFTK
jgi:ALG6, ALG8 glycosyltransferase family